MSRSAHLRFKRNQLGSASNLERLLIQFPRLKTENSNPVPSKQISMPSAGPTSSCSGTGVPRALQQFSGTPDYADRVVLYTGRSATSRVQENTANATNYRRAYIVTIHL